MSIILDERAYVEGVLEAPSLGRKPSETLSRVAKYYRANGYKDREITGLVEDFLLKCDPNINIVKWQALIDKVVRLSAKYGLVVINGIDITESEMKRIEELESKVLQRLMFSFLCVAKYCNAVNPNNNNWVNKADKEVFALAGIRTSLKRQSLMINDLWSAGYISFSNVVDNININVRIVDNDSRSVLTVTDFRNLGNQLLMYYGEPYMECPCCGIIVKRNSNAQKYCNDCASEVNIKNTIERYHTLKH